MGRPRVLYLAHNFPQMSHTYIRSEIEALRDDCDIRVIGLRPSDLEYREHHPYERTSDPDRIREVVREYRPDVLHSHWLHQVPTLAYFGGYFARGPRAAEVPFTVRAHSFDILEKNERFLQTIVPIVNSGLCLGVLTFPFTRPLLEQAGVAADKIRDCYPVVNFARFHDRSPNGEGVMNVGACLPKKQMEDFVRLAKLVPGRRFNLYAMGYNVGLMERYRREWQSPVAVVPPVEPHEMAAEYKKHQWLVYTAAFNPSTVGWPMAVAEAQAAGVGVCMPNLRPDLREYVGDAGVLYDRIEDVVDIVSKPVPREAREAGFELARRSDVAVHKRLLLDLWANASAGRGAADAAADGPRPASIEGVDWGPVGVNWAWAERVAATARDIEATVGAGRPFAIVDEGQLAPELPPTLRPASFPSAGGQYLGPPADGAAAVDALERARGDGAAAIVFVAASFWWLDYYTDLAHHLRSSYRCVRENERVVVFDLATPGAVGPLAEGRADRPGLAPSAVA